jgi:hypothetical protein
MGLLTIKNKFGSMVGWNKVTVNMMGRDVEGITEIEYDDDVDLDNAYGQGKYPIGRGEGNYKAKASITLYIEESIAIQRSLLPGMNLSDIKPFDVTVEYEYTKIKYKDRIRNCQFKGRGVAVKQGDKTIAYKHALLPSHIDWNII